MSTRFLPLVALAALVAPLSAQSPILSTMVGGLVWTNTSPPPMTQLFDISVVHPSGLTFSQIDVNCNTAAGTSGTFGVWVTAPGVSANGNHLNAAAWTQVATAAVTHTGGQVAIVLPTPFYLAPGSYGVALSYTGMNPVYTNPTTAGLPNTYSTTEATLDMTFGRVRPATVAGPFTGTSNGSSPRHANVRMHYSVGPISVDFVGTPLTGSSPLDVQFTPYAFSGNPGGIQAYLWDFGDGNTSTTTAPLHTYTTCGDYTVSLTIFDVSGSYAATKTNYVKTDVVTPKFKNDLVGPNMLLFTDLSDGTPTGWAWDFDNDTIIDSTLQNPIWTFPNACEEQIVTLTVTRACKTATLTKRIAVASSFETTFQSGLIISTTAPGGTSFVDVNVLNPLGVTVCAMHLNSNVATGTPVTVNVWQKAGTYVGAVTDATQWRMIHTSTVNSLGYGARTLVQFSPPIHLAFGVSGLGFELVGGSPAYTNLGGPVTYSNADLTLTAGLVQLSPIFGPAATSTQYSPRIWNGALHYSTTATTGAAGYGYIGAGCAGTLGVPSNVATSQPIIGTTSTWTFGNLPFGIGVLILGASRVPGLDLAIIGMPGCPLFASPDVTLTLVGAGTSASFPFPIPNNPTFLGIQLYTQALSLDLGLNPMGLGISDAAVALIGQ